MSEERRSIVAEWLQSEGAVTVTDLQSRFGVSPMTARRDLSILAERGSRGGRTAARSCRRSPRRENSFAQRLRRRAGGQGAARGGGVRAAAAGETLFLDSSSTTYFLARLIAERGLGVRVMTNSAARAAGARGRASEVEVIAIGGTFRRLTCSYVGPTAVRAVREHFADRLFLSVTGVTRTA